METRELVAALFEEAGVPVVAITERAETHSSKVLPYDTVVVKTRGGPRKIALDGTVLFICKPDVCTHNEQHSVDLADPNSIEIIKGWVPWLEQRRALGWPRL